MTIGHDDSSVEGTESLQGDRLPRWLVRVAVWFATGTAILFMLFFAFMAYGAWALGAHGASMSQVDRVRIGMAQKEVQTILGNPGRVDSHDDGSKVWTYSRMTWCMVRVYIGTTGEVTEVEHDH